MTAARRNLLLFLSLPLGLGLAWARYRFFQFEALGNAALALALALQFVGYQKVMAGSAISLADSLVWTHWGWFLFALALPGAGPALGSTGFLALLLLVRLPLAGLLGERGLIDRWPLLAALFALVGSLPFPFFSAYLLAFLPMFSVGDSVSSMTQKLFSGTGLWAAVVLLSVVYQSSALGYFYWSQVLSQKPQDDPGRRGPWQPLLWAGLGLSLALCLSGAYGNVMRAITTGLGVKLP